MFVCGRIASLVSLCDSKHSHKYRILNKNKNRGHKNHNKKQITFGDQIGLGGWLGYQSRSSCCNFLLGPLAPLAPLAPLLGPATAAPSSSSESSVIAFKSWSNNPTQQRISYNNLNQGLRIRYLYFSIST